MSILRSWLIIVLVLIAGSSEGMGQSAVRYGVQIGAFLYTGLERLLPLARKVAMEQRCEVGIWNQGSWYKVIAGNFDRMRAARRLQRQLRRQYPGAFVVVLPDAEDRVARILPGGTVRTRSSSALFPVLAVPAGVCQLTMPAMLRRR